MSTLEAPDHFSSTTSWRARVRFVRDLAPKGMGVFMAPQRSMVLRLSDLLYRRTPLTLGAVAIAWGSAVLTLWPVVSVLGLVLWSALVAAAWVFLAVQWWRADRPMLRPGGAPFWANEHVSSLWILYLAMASAIIFVFPVDSATHQPALCLILVGLGVVSAVLSSSSIRALAAVLGPTIGLVAIVLMLRGNIELAASVALAGGVCVLGTVGLFKLAADHARRDVETA